MKRSAIRVGGVLLAAGSVLLIAAQSSSASPSLAEIGQGVALCSTSSDCGGYGTCSGGQCGHCSTSSDCKSGGSCSGGRCSNYIP